MKCKVLCVYKDVNGKQCLVDYSLDNGRVSTADMDSFIKSCNQHRVVQENFKIISAGLSGKNCNLDFKEYMSWDEIVSKYPKKWVVLDKILSKPDSLDVDRAAIIAVLDDNDIDDFMSKCFKKGLLYAFFRTEVYEDFKLGALELSL